MRLSANGKRIGRPRDNFSQMIADRICELLASNQIGIRRLCQEHSDLPDPQTIYRWQMRHPSFREQYARAKQLQLQAFEDEMIDIADDGRNDFMEVKFGETTAWRENGEAVRRSQLRVDTRKWLMSKLLPKKYGDSTNVKLTDANGGAVQFAVVRSILDDAPAEKPALTAPGIDANKSNT